MAGKVNNSTAQQKWDSLKGSAGVSLSRIVQGKASSADFQRVQNILSQQSSLASQVFSQALKSAEAQAKKFESAYSAVIDTNNKELLSSFEVALNAELQKVTPDLVGQLKEIIEMSNASHSEELDKAVGSRLDSFKELLPKEKDVPSLRDIIAANDQLALRVESDLEHAWNQREPDLLDKIADVFQSTLRDLADKINHERAARASNGQRALPAPSAPLLLGGPSEAPVANPSVLSRGMSLVHGEEGQVLGSSEAGSSGVSDGGTTVVALSPATQKELTTAATAQKDFYSRVKSLLPSASQSGNGDAEDEAKESKKADTWWRSFKNWFGDSDDKKKKGDKFSWLKTLGTTLALMILNPKLFSTLADGIKNMLSWENLKKGAIESWEFVKNESSKVLETIANMLGGTMKSPTQADATGAKEGGKDLATTKNKAGDTKHADINNLTPEQKKQFDAFGKANKENTGGVDGASTGMNSIGASALNKGLAMVGITTPAMKAYNLAHTDTNANSPTYGHILIDGKDKGKNPDFKPQSSVATGSARSSVQPPPLPQTMPTGSNASTTFSEPSSFKNSPGVALPSGDMTPTPGGSAAMMPQKGSPQIGIGSFGYTAANSDSLPLMNTYHFTGG